MDKPKLLIVEDDEEIRAQMKWALAGDYDVSLAADRPAAMEVLRAEHPAVVTLDLGLPPHPSDATEGLATLDEILEVDLLTKVIIISGNSDRTNALQAVERGAYDFIEKPVQVEVLNIVLQRAVAMCRLEQENLALREREQGAAFHEILGDSPPMQRVFETIRRVAGSDISVLILGESGTGKELIARAIHRQSGRRDFPLIAVNCGAIPENLLESELFGHEKGAFTGAHAQRKGRIESAQGGTLFFDEVGELPLPLQVKLLRFLQEQCVERVGGREAIAVDVRMIAATNTDLAKAMHAGRFREDLYYRLEGVTIVAPPLRERGADIELLAKALLQRYADEYKKSLPRFTEQAINAIRRYNWPGNVRELENRIKRAVMMAEGRKLTLDDLEFGVPSAKSEGRTLKEVRETVEKDLIERVVARYAGNITKAATDLGISRPTLHQLLVKYGIARH